MSWVIKYLHVLIKYLHVKVDYRGDVMRDVMGVDLGWWTTGADVNIKLIFE